MASQGKAPRAPDRWPAAGISFVRKTMKKMNAALIALILTGCAAGVKPITTPDGKRGFVVTCDGSADDWSTCYQAATKACNGKYGIIDRNESSTPTVYGPMVRRHMVAECK
jgi:hypothetical protein